ncbi:MAG: uracil phosphoribosyltransferase [Dysgonamonadaceae bacterium]|jgi:uracil phosphoribosyltransferase|nr:uracil phosphoribosyltransferase [Dysgonamonadaceae bacterium]
MKINNLSETNSILNHFIAEMRDVTIHHDSLRFRRNIERIGNILAYEISKTLDYQVTSVKTPLGIAEAPLYSNSVVLAPVLRAGLPLHQGFLQFFDKAENAFVSASRQYSDNEHKHFEIVVEYLSSPAIDNKTLILIDPMLATGASLEFAYKTLLKRGTPWEIHIACVIGSRFGVKALEKIFPSDKTTLWVGTIDPELDEKAYIVPGLGDAGDLAYGCKI